MPSLRFTLNQISSFQSKTDPLQALENKSAFSEGLIASDVLFWNQFLNFKISARMFFSTESPLEELIGQFNYLPPIKTELDYIEQRVKLISQCRKLINSLPKNSAEFTNIENVLLLLCFQLYGFGQKLIEDGKILYGLIALREAGILEKDFVRQKLVEFAKCNPNFASTISEFIS